eukprot:gb/GFBE01048012.1/.p1 GENE.gb/GFBE01048012.1/~~gb/GFBE01048012.1/.p1  ORF type:complete len:256 (+),score=48.60 gb/GFBE01048012.1/:1-768(+)
MPVDDAAADASEETVVAAAEPYASFDVEGGDDQPLAAWKSRWLGRILVYNFGGQIIYIGPHWYCSIIMLAFILGVGSFHTISVANQGAQDFLSGMAVTVLTVLSFLRCALSDPGVLRQGSQEAQEAQAQAQEAGDADALNPNQGSSSSQGRRHFGGKNGGRTCETCKLVQPRGCSHCSFCQVCVEGHDHHCPWMGKCIGKKNLCKFYTFLVVAFSSLGYIFIVALTAPLPTDVVTHAPSWEPVKAAKHTVDALTE